MKPLIIFLCWMLAVTPVWADCTPPVLDDASLNVTRPKTTPSQISTSASNELILYFSALLGDELIAGHPSPLPPVVTGITDTAGLTWHERGSVVTYQQVPVATCGGGRCSINTQMWWAYSPAQLTNDVLTPSYSFPPPAFTFAATFGVQNIINPTNPFDDNPSLPAANSFNLDGETYNITFSTSQAADLILVSCGTIALTDPLCDVLQANPAWRLFATWGDTNLGGVQYGAVMTRTNAAPGSWPIVSGQPNWLAKADAVAGCGAAVLIQQPQVWINEGP